MSAEVPGQREPLIPRLSPVVKLKLGNIALELTYNNTVMWRFGHGYGYMNHVFVETEPETHKGYRVWNDTSPEVEEELVALDFESLRKPYPPDCDVEAWEKEQASRIDKEAKELLTKKEE